MFNSGIIWARWLAAFAVCFACSLTAARGETLSLTVEEFHAYLPHALPEQRVRLSGTITAFMGDDYFYLQDPTGGTLVHLRSIAKNSHLHDDVEISSRIEKGGPAGHIEASGVRILGHGTKPAPLDLSAQRPPTLADEGLLVRFRARVAAGEVLRPEGRQVLVRAFGTRLPVIYSSLQDGHGWPAAEAEDLVEVTGVLALPESGATSMDNFRVIASRRTDMRLLARAPWWLKQRTPLLAGAGALAVGGLAWAVRRRRKATRKAELPRPIVAKELAPESDMERRYREIFESATDIILTHDLDGRITSFNPAGERLLGWPASEVIGQPIYRIMAPAEAEIAGGLVKPGGTPEIADGGSFRLELKTQDGRTMPFEVNSWIEYQEGEPVGVQAICRNISHRLRSEDERVRLDRRLQDTQKLESLGILAGGIAHDFNNLLTAVLGNASLGRIELPPDSPTQKSLEEIEIAAERAAELCSQMLAYSGQGRFVISRVNLSALVVETLELLQASVSKRSKLELHLADNLPTVHGDTVQLRQVLVNLVTNASEALGDGHGTVTVRTSVMNAEPQWLIDAQLVPEHFEGEYVVLEVTDTGCGMNPETAARMFEPFFTTNFTGRGLGLAAVLGIVRSHRGALKVETQLGQGTSFRIALPAIGVLGSHAGGDAEARPLFHATVLVVDDEAAVRRTITRVLEMMGCKVVGAEDGTVALERVRQYGRPFELVLLDLTMPQMDGVQTLRELRRLRPDLPVILMSGFAQAQAMARFGEHRLAGFLQKPFKLDDLSRLASNALTEHQGLFANLR